MGALVYLMLAMGADWLLSVGIDKIIRIGLSSEGSMSLIYMRYSDKSLKERILEVWRHLQVAHDDRWSQRLC